MMESINYSDKLVQQSRIVFLDTTVSEETCSEIVKRLLYLDTINHNPIHFYIMSGGGDVTAGLAVIDTMNIIKSPVYTYAVGRAYSMGCVFLAAGVKGHRYALENASIMMHEGSEQVKGTFSNTHAYLEFSKKLNTRINHLMSKWTGQSYEKISKDSIIDFWMFAEEAKEYGFVDHVITNEELDQLVNSTVQTETRQDEPRAEVAVQATK